MSRARQSLEEKRHQRMNNTCRKRAVRSNGTKRKRQAKMSTVADDLLSAIKDVVNQAKKKLHRTRHPNDPK